LEQFINNLITLNPVWIYLVTAAIAFIENIFPPFPSDVVLVAGGYLCATGRVDFITILFIATASSTAGFMTMFKIGEWFGLKVIETGRFKFLKLDNIHKVETWFNKYGYLVVILNRFIAGTRAVISFFTGISNLSFWKTTVLAAVSSLAWNLILLSAGKTLGSNWRSIVSYLETYGKIVAIISIIVVILILGSNYFIKRNRSNI